MRAGGSWELLTGSDSLLGLSAKVESFLDSDAVSVAEAVSAAVWVLAVAVAVAVAVAAAGSDSDDKVVCAVFSS